MTVLATGAGRVNTAPVREEISLYWPSRAIVADGGVFDANMEQAGSLVYNAAWGALLGAGSAVMRQALFANTGRMVVGEFLNSMRWLIGCAAHIPEDQSLFPSGFKRTPFYSVYEIAFMMRASAILNSNTDGFSMLACSGTNPDEFPQVGFPRAGFGIRPSTTGAASGWGYVAWGNAVKLEEVDIPAALVAAPTAIAQYSFELIAPALGRPAKMNLRVNGALVVSRNFDNILLPFVTNGIAAATCWVPAFRNKDAVKLMHIGNIMVRYSRYGIDGRDYSL